MIELLFAATKGFATSAGLITAIGSQNAFVLTNGIKNNFKFSIATTCCLLDVLLICLGIGGMHVLISAFPSVGFYAAIGGAIFLFIYGSISLASAFSSKALTTGGKIFNTHYQAILTTLAISLLNPHVYLDTVILIGSIGSQLGTPGKWWFAFGASFASILWFSLLSYGAKLMAPWFAKPVTWKILDLVIWAVMWAIAYSLVMHALG